MIKNWNNVYGLYGIGGAIAVNRKEAGQNEIDGMIENATECVTAKSGMIRKEGEKT